MSRALDTVNRNALAPTLEPLRFGDFLRERSLITDRQWLAALAEHWSTGRARIGETLVAQGALSAEVIEHEARRFHNLDTVLVDTDLLGA